MAYEKERDFYIHLESVRNSMYPTNTPGDFELVLPNRIDLEQNPNYFWQVGLSELSIPNGFYNIEHEKKRLYYGIRIHAENKNLIPALKDDTDEHPNTHPNKNKWSFEMANVREEAKDDRIVTSPFYYRLFPVELPEGFYDPESFVLVLNQRLNLVKEIIVKEEPDFWPTKDKYLLEVKYDKATRKIILLANYEKDTKKEEYLVVTSESLRHLFGCHTLNTRLLGNGPLEYMCNLDRGFQKLYVYSNIVKYSMINNIQAPILRIVQMSKELHDNYFGLTSYFTQRASVSKSMFTPHFEHIQYYTLENQEYIDKIHLKLSNEFGQDIDFHDIRDVTSVTLHIRQTKRK